MILKRDPRASLLGGVSTQGRDRDENGAEGISEMIFKLGICNTMYLLRGKSSLKGSCRGTPRAHKKNGVGIHGENTG